MINSFFIDYANYSLRKDPKNLLKIFKPNILALFKDYEEEISNTLEKIIFFSTIKSIKKAATKYSRIWEKHFYAQNDENGSLYPTTHWLDLAYYGAYGFGENSDWVPSKPCFDTCHWNGDLRANYIDKNLMLGFKKLKCHECDQLFFMSILKQITNGREYSQIIGLHEVLGCSTECVSEKITLNKDNNNSGFRERIEKSLELIPHSQIEHIDQDYYLGRFTVLIFGVIAYSLSGFLIQNDRRKLNYCEKCHKFYISKSIRKQRFCSDRCRIAWHNHERIKSGEHARYKRKKREQGAKESYYG